MTDTIHNDDLDALVVALRARDHVTCTRAAGAIDALHAELAEARRGTAVAVERERERLREMVRHVRTGNHEQRETWPVPVQELSDLVADLRAGKEER